MKITTKNRDGIYLVGSLLENLIDSKLLSNRQMLGRFLYFI